MNKKKKKKKKIILIRSWNLLVQFSDKSALFNGKLKMGGIQLEFSLNALIEPACSRIVEWQYSMEMYR